MSNNNKANLRDLIAVICLVMSCWNQIQITDLSARLKFNGRPTKKSMLLAVSPQGGAWMLKATSCGRNWCSSKLWVSSHSHMWIRIVVIVCKRSNRGQIIDLWPVWPWNLIDDLENYRASLPCSYTLCVSFYNYPWIQIEVVIWKHPNQSQIIEFSAHVTLQFDGWPWRQ